MAGHNTQPRTRTSTTSGAAPCAQPFHLRRGTQKGLYFLRSWKRPARYKLRTRSWERVNELESGIIPLLFKEGNVSALEQSVNSFIRSELWGVLVWPLIMIIRSQSGEHFPKEHLSIHICFIFRHRHSRRAGGQQATVSWATSSDVFSKWRGEGLGVQAAKTLKVAVPRGDAIVRSSAERAWEPRSYDSRATSRFRESFSRLDLRVQFAFQTLQWLSIGSAVAVRPWALWGYVTRRARYGVRWREQDNDSH